VPILGGDELPSHVGFSTHDQYSSLPENVEQA